MKESAKNRRSCGVLLPVFSLPSPHGIGCFSKEAYAFVDFLKSAGQSCWQILPLGPTSYGDSPYQSFSTFAGNPYYIDLESLAKEGYLSAADLRKDAAMWRGKETIDYAALYQNRIALLRKAYEAKVAMHGAMKSAYRYFVRDNAFWLKDYTLFMALKDARGGKPWTEWEEDLKTRNTRALSKARKQYADDIGFYLFVQFTFRRQWNALKNYANEQGIDIVGDLPIYVALDSADAWANPELFELDEKRNPVRVAGCPPDDYAKTGQLWGNPLYKWNVHKKTGYAWWISRMKHALSVFDIVRIDHFRGFEAYYAIPASHKTAEHGVWVKGPGMSLFEALEKGVEDASTRPRLIAENLGFLTPEVHRLIEKTGYPGMKVLQFAFYPGEDGRFASEYLPWQYDRNCVVYTGTHDNDTTIGWFATLGKKERAFVCAYLGLEAPPEEAAAKGKAANKQKENAKRPHTKAERALEEAVADGLVRMALSSVADMAIIPLQDYLHLDERARVNTPSTLGKNWMWRMPKGAATKTLAKQMRVMAEAYGRTS